MNWGDSFRRAAEGGSDYDPPDGRYTVKIVDAGAFRARSGGQKEWCKVKLQIVGGDEAGNQFEDFGPAGDHGGASFDFMVERLLGYGLTGIEGFEDIEDLNAAMEDQLIGREADIGVVHKDKYRNVNVFGSRTSGVSDIPTEDPKPNGEQRQAASFADAAKTDDGPTPF